MTHARTVAQSEDSLALLEFPKVVALLCRRTQTAYGHALAASLRPITDIVTLEAVFAETAELLKLHAEQGLLPVGQGDDLLPHLDGVRVEGKRLAPEVLRDVRFAIEAATACRERLCSLTDAPRLEALGEGLVALPELAADLKASIGERGEILDTASLLLADLRREVQAERSRIRRQLEKLLGDENLQGVFQEALVTDRNGRYVLPVRTDHSGRLKGFVHDVSASGQTLYVEPAAVLDANNRLQTQLREIQREEERVLARLTAAVRTAREALIGNQAILAQLDLRQAVCRLSRDLDASIPELVATPQLDLRDARHPLLILDAEGAQAEPPVVPVDLRLSAAGQVLVISGPNTGGKTAALKTIGLLLLMARSGLPIPCAPGSRLFPFGPVLADIGDEQSLEQSLSTFSGHLLRLKRILERADERTLVLLDELGTGTDPSEGAALALATLDHLRQVEARVVATTHLHVIKGYAHLEPGVENAAVEFDVETLQPTYRLHYGIPGASHAFTIAERLGLPTALLDKAGGYLGRGEREGLAVIERLQALRAALEEELHTTGSLRREVEQERNRHRQLREGLEQRQREILNQTREQGGRLLAEAEAQIRALFREVEPGRRQPKEQARVTQQVRELRQALPEARPDLPGTAPGEIAVGELLHVPALGVDAEVVEVDGKSVNLAVGGKKLRQPLKALRQYQPRRFARQAPAEAKIRDRVPRNAFRPRLVLVGKRVDDAVGLLERFLDEALLHGEAHLEVVHGAGQGILRRAVRECLAGRNEVTAFHAADVSAGGDNVTVVELEPR